jgi:two-component system OmpR family response regulator
MQSILLVDDETNASKAFAQTLAQFGFKVNLAPTYESALRRIVQKRFDAILVEFNLRSALGSHPRAGKGLQLVHRLHRSRLHVPILIVTAMNGEHYKRASLQAGADGFIAKTISIHRIVARIQAHILRLDRAHGLRTKRGSR